MGVSREVGVANDMEDWGSRIDFLRYEQVLKAIHLAFNEKVSGWEWHLLYYTFKAHCFSPQLATTDLRWWIQGADLLRDWNSRSSPEKHHNERYEIPIPRLWSCHTMSNMQEGERENCGNPLGWSDGSCVPSQASTCCWSLFESKRGKRGVAEVFSESGRWELGVGTSTPASTDSIHSNPNIRFHPSLDILHSLNYKLSFDCSALQPLVLILSSIRHMEPITTWWLGCFENVLVLGVRRY